jgi:hypothetical protein
MRVIFKNALRWAMAFFCVSMRQNRKASAGSAEAFGPVRPRPVFTHQLLEIRKIGFSRMGRTFRQTMISPAA